MFHETVQIREQEKNLFNKCEVIRKNNNHKIKISNAKFHEKNVLLYTPTPSMLLLFY